ncbi:MAG: hypothetical protein LBU86_00010 [Oscillospiraceae bacterium]|jgi:hypothetical protein|nr:hypothetical protein [Oscillospiraceae bacterium]
MERENYYVLLELPIDPPCVDPGQIRAAIGRKKLEWTRWQDNPAKRTLALAYLGMVPDIEENMFSPTLRKQEAREAKLALKHALRRFEAELRILEGKGHILPREVAALAARYRVWGVDQNRVRQSAKTPVSDLPPPPATEEAGEIIDRVTAKSIKRNLSVAGFPDLYAFLGEPRYSSIKKLREAAETRRREAASSRSPASAAAQELAGMALRLFESFDTKQMYDRYLKVSDYPGLAEMIDEEFTRQKYLSNEALLRLINYGVEACGIRVLEAEEFIRRYSGAYHIPVGGEKPLIRCPACKERVTRESVVCSYCAQPLSGFCPGCDTPYEEGPAACPACGFLLGDMVKALPYLDDARGALIEGKWSVAHRGLQFVENYWPAHPELEQLRKRSQQLEERYARLMGQIDDCIAKIQYYAALSLIEEAEAKNVATPSATVRQVRRVLDDLEAQLAAIAGAPDLDVPLLMRLERTVSDSLEVQRLLSGHPPEAPTSLSASVAGRVVRLGWSDAGAPGAATYLLVRLKGSVPLTPFDGDVIYEGQACSFVDRAADPLADYYYRVFTKRSTIYSKNGASFGPVTLIPELENLRILPADQGAQISWRFNPDIKEVIIWRKLGGERPEAPGEGVLLETGRVDGFVDTRIKNDVEYWYYLSAVYQVEGKRLQSKGVCEMITPHRILAPTDRLAIAASQYGDNEYVVNWNNPELRDLILLASNTKPKFKTGEIFPVQELLGSYRNLSLHARTADSGRFRYSFTGGAFIFAATLFGKFAAVGEPCYLTNLRDVTELTADLIDGDLCLNMRWPPGLNEIAVVYRPDGYPASPAELGAGVIRVTKEEYDYDAGVIIKRPAGGSFYFKVFAVYQGAEGEEFSEGVALAWSNQPRQEIFYRFAYKKKLIGKQAELSLTLSGPKIFTMPTALIVGRRDRLPLSRADGEVMFELNQETRVNGEVVFQYQVDPVPPETCLRLFFADDNYYRGFRLLPSSELKIT